MLYFDRSMFYTGRSFCQNSNYTLKIYTSQGISVLLQKKLNIELLFVCLLFLDGIELAILKLVTLYSRIVQMSKYIEGARFLTSGERSYSGGWAKTRLYYSVGLELEMSILTHAFKYTNKAK